MNATFVRFTLAVAGIAGAFLYLAAGGGTAQPVAVADRSPQITQSSWFSPLVVAEDTPAAAPVAAQRQHPAGEDQQTGRDLHALFLRLSQSDDALDLKQAAGIFADCGALLAGRQALDERIAGAGGTYAARSQAAAELSQRCQGFRQAAGTDLKAQRQALLTRLADRGLDPEAGAQAGNALLAPSMVRSLLAQDDPAAFEEARPALARALAGRLGITEETPAWDDLQAALLLAGCARGAACGPDSFDALRRCAYQDRCGGGRFEGWQEGLPAERSARVALLRSQVMAGLQARDYAALGLN